MINIYGKDNCSFCVQAKNVAEQYSLSYTYFDIGADDDAWKEFQEKFPGVRTVPQIEWAGKHVGGYEDFLKEVESTRSAGDAF